MAESLVQAMAGIERERKARRNRNKAQLIQGIGTAIQIEERRNTMKAQEAFVSSSLADLQTITPGWTPPDTDPSIDPMTRLNIAKSSAQAFGVDERRTTETQLFSKRGITDESMTALHKDKFTDGTPATKSFLKKEAYDKVIAKETEENKIEASGYSDKFYKDVPKAKDIEDAELLAGAHKEWADAQANAKAIWESYNNAEAKALGKRVGEGAESQLKPYEDMSEPEKNTFDVIRNRFSFSITTNDELQLGNIVRKQIESIELLEYNEKIILEKEVNRNGDVVYSVMDSNGKKLKGEKLKRVTKLNTNLIELQRLNRVKSTGQRSGATADEMSINPKINALLTGK